MVSALQAHLAIRPADVALAVTDALRSYLPDLIALAAAAPFSAGADTGLATVRPIVSTLLPRQGVPPVLGSWEGYAAVRRWLARTGVDDERRVWWEVRLRPQYGTIEVRAMDAQPTVDAAVALVALTAGLAVRLADRVRDGETLPVHPTERIAENRWRAVRGGRAATLADLDTGDLEPLDTRIGRLLDDVAPVVERLGGGHLLDDVDALRRRNGADRMREVAAEHGIPAVAPWLAEVFDA
jgi:glutamate---cysteine ligase / carboxylate-amine ligase